MDIPSALQSLKVAIDYGQAIYSSLTSLGKAEERFKQSEYICTISDANMALAYLQDQLREKDNEIDRLKQKLCLKDSTVFDGHLY